MKLVTWIKWEKPQQQITTYIKCTELCRLNAYEHVFDATQKLKGNQITIHWISQASCTSFKSSQSQAITLIVFKITKSNQNARESKPWWIRNGSNKLSWNSNQNKQSQSRGGQGIEQVETKILSKYQMAEIIDVNREKNGAKSR